MVRRILRYAVIARVLGVLLLAAAALKVQGLGFDPVRRLGIFAAPEFQVAVVEFEVFLGLWLLAGIRPLGSWFLALSAFLAFAGVSFYLGWVGQSSCGCFGRLSPSPWYTFGLDVGIIAALFVARPDLAVLKDKPASTLTAAVVPAACGFGGVVALSGLVLGLAYFTFGSVPAAVAYFRGERVSVLPRLVDVGEGFLGERRSVNVELANWTDKPIRVIGGTADCSCSVLADLPMTIPPKQVRAVSIDFYFRGKPGLFTRQTAISVDDEGLSRLDFGIVGRIVPTQELPPVTSGGS